MEHLSRRHVLQLLGATGAGVVGSSALAPLASAVPDPGTDAAAVPPPSGPLIGMSSPDRQWATRIAQVGPGIGARRIFADLADGPTSQLRLVRDAHAAGQLPVISYKAGGSIADTLAGRYDTVAAQAAAQLAALGKPTAVTFWHEPHGNMTPAQFVAANRRMVPIFQRGGASLRVGPLLNGFLLDRQVATFAQYAPDDLLALWDFFGIDTYEAGTMTSPGTAKPAPRIGAARTFLTQRGFATMPLGIGEYNGYSARTITDAGNALLTTSGVWFGCLWNSTGGKGVALSGDRLTAFRGTVAAAAARNGLIG
ncbi:hypothetical protein [Nocardioides okcheonensis]|uniref:hypothetical protein n=1 Tax=Nocardioides okcheonensis TaxID=2894081 RepID=UPI001E4D029D|nr:hypothetical protein [Nocardioides okcheonensis]UFN46311.1 hypothetical protein LN652_08955 [Nocardioides okcheonensis]